MSIDLYSIKILFFISLCEVFCRCDTWNQIWLKTQLTVAQAGLDPEVYLLSILSLVRLVMHYHVLFYERHFMAVISEYRKKQHDVPGTLVLNVDCSCSSESWRVSVLEAAGP